MVAPSDIANLAAWYDASDAATITATGGAVSQWNDKSGNARHLTQATSAQQPTTGTRTLNGKNALDFVGATWIRATGFTINQPFTWLAVYAFDTIATATAVCSHASTANTNDIGKSVGSWRARSGAILVGASADTAPHVFVTQHNGATSFLRRDGVLDVSGDVGTRALGSGISIGADGNGNTPLDGYVAEVCLYSRVLTSTEIADLEAYLTGKWLAVPPVALAGKAATASSAKASILRRARPVAGKAATATSARATRVTTARALAGKAATSTSAKATTVRRARTLAGRAAVASSAKSATFARTRQIAARAPISTSARATTIRRARSLAARAATSTSAKATLTVTGPSGGPVDLAGKAATATSARATLRRLVRVAGHAATATSARAATANRSRPLAARAAIATDAHATLTVRLTIGGKPYVWTGTAWVPYPVKLWTGTAWIEYPMYVYNGTAWEPV